MNKGVQLGWLGVESTNNKDSNKFGSFLKNTKKFIAFTLAETLIVMGIIGVVAALTIPNLNSSTNDAEKVAKVKKEYAVLTEAVERATAVYGPIATWFVNDGNDYDKTKKRLYDRITEFMKVTKFDYHNGVFYLADGAKLVFDFEGECDNTKYISGSHCFFAQVYLDIDGDKGKNRAGFDVFEFSLTNKGVIPNGPVSNDYDYDTFCDRAFSMAGISCFKEAGYIYDVTNWIIVNGNMDYLKLDADGKCPNGEVLSWTKTSCR